jgi:hypothetical protein
MSVLQHIYIYSTEHQDQCVQNENSVTCFVWVRNANSSSIEHTLQVQYFDILGDDTIYPVRWVRPNDVSVEHLLLISNVSQKPWCQGTRLHCVIARRLQYESSHA